MAQVFGKLESLKKLRSKLQFYGVDQFNSIQEIKDFQRNINKIKEEICLKNTLKVDKEIVELKNNTRNIEAYIEKNKADKRLELNNAINSIKRKINVLESSESNWFQKFINKIRIYNYKNNLHDLNNDFDKIINKSGTSAMKQLQIDKEQLEYLSNNTKIEIDIRNAPEIYNIDNTKRVIDKVYPQIAGAIGENKVLNELKKLSDEFYIINDFSLEFDSPIYNRREDDKIFSIQIDHLVVSKSGIYILETKNWSKKSIDSNSLRSPIKQIERTGFALFVIINKAIERGDINICNSNWGNKKIPIKNIVVMINNKPEEEFNFVKIVSLGELNGYLKYFKDVLNQEEVESLVKYLLKIKDFYYM